MLSRLAFVAASLALLAGCPHHKDDGTGPGSGSGSDSKPIDAGVAELPERGTPGNPLLPPEGVDPAALACVYHAAAAGYFTCTNANAGTCFHFGAPCNPRDACMFDASSKLYKSCATMVEGTCTSWGTGCTPTGACMFDPSDNLHRFCDSPADGACKSWGALCDPG